MKFSNFDLLLSLPISAYWKDMGNIYQGGNQKMLEMVNFDNLDELVGRTDYELPWCSKAQELESFTRSIIETRTENSFELEFLHNGLLICYLVTERPLCTPEDEVVGVVGTLINISDRKRLELALDTAKSDALEKFRLTNVYLENILTNLPDPIYWLDKNSVTLGANDAEAQLYGLKTGKEMIGKSIFDFAKILGWDDEVTNRLRQNDLEVMQSGIPMVVEETGILNNEIRIFLSHKAPLYDENKEKIIGIIGNATDITERKAMEKELKEALEAAEASDRAKTDFIQNMSHDVKTPLAGIISMAHRIGTQLEEPDALEDNYENVQMIKNSGKQLIEFFMNCLEMGRIETEGVALSNENFNPQTITDQLVEMLTPSMKQKGLGFYSTYDPAIPEMVYASAPGFYRIILNLLGNAIKFTEEGSISMDILLQKTRDEDTGKEKEELCLKVRDTGMGIPQEKIASIFERFTRLTPSYEGKFEGHGIGLYIVHKFVTLMGGKIDVDSEVGKGSCFTITFPFLPAKAFLKPRAVKPKFTKLAPLGDAASEEEKIGPRILLVEDNRMAQKGVESILTHLGYTVDIVDTGEKALEIFELDKYVLIITDIGLTDMSGLAVAKHIRTLEKGRKNPVPIVALTAHNVEKVQAECAAAGINGVLEKPLTEEVAREVLDCFLKK